jgi:pimeloyl-ACP methyl ester carboxylesterase
LPSRVGSEPRAASELDEVGGTIGRAGQFGKRDGDFEQTAKSFENPDWPEITRHSYSVRWGEADKDPRYADLDHLVAAAQSISVPTLMIHGCSDAATLPESTEGKNKYFTGGYARHVIPEVGHFPTREAPEPVNKLIMDFLRA